MTRVITYGTFDLFHEGHRRLLERARELGDYLIVGVTTESYDDSRGKLNIRQSLMERIQNVQQSGLADEIIIEEAEGQKITDIQRFGADLFVVGSDWRGKFDYLSDYCPVVYLERTKDVSSTALRNAGRGVIRIGIVGAGRIAARFVAEARFVSGVTVESIWTRDAERAAGFAREHELNSAAPSLAELLSRVDALYVATPHDSHVEYATAGLSAGVHVLCEKPLALAEADAAALFGLAKKRGLVLMEAIKTAFAPGFQRMVAVARSGSIGRIRSVDATFTRLLPTTGREFRAPAGGAISELASYPLLAVTKLLGTDFLDQRTLAYRPRGSEVDQYARIDLTFDNAIASSKVGIGVKAEGDLVVAGTRGYLYVPAPWWKTEYFETRFESPGELERYYVKFNGDGLRYELAHFADLIRSGETESFKLRPTESIAIAGMIERARSEQVIFG